MSSNSSLGETGTARRGRAAAAALGYLLALGLTCLVFVWTASGQRLDGWLLRGAEQGGYQQRGMPVEAAQAALSVLGDPVVLGAVLVAILLLGVLRRRWWLGAGAVGVVLGSTLVANVLKVTVSRPDLGVAGSTTHNSFPSGHVTVAASLLLALLMVLPARARCWVALPGAVAVSVACAATMIAGWHRFSDTVGGVLVAMAVCGPVLASLPPATVSHESHEDSRVGAAAAVLVAPVVIAFGAAGLHADEGLFTGMVAASGCAAVAVVSVLLSLRT